jgi:hypothetical protein
MIVHNTRGGMRIETNVEIYQQIFGFEMQI